MRLTASTSRQEIRERFGAGDAETLRAAEKRRRYLQKYARLLTDDRPAVRFSSDLHTATTEYDGDRPAVTVTTRAFDQPVTDLRRRAFDLAIQEALVVHEVGHLRYTDIAGFRELLPTVDADRRRLFARVWNTLEDGAVERQLRHEYAVATELDLLNANLVAGTAFGRATPEDGVSRFSLFHAVVCGLSDMAVYDSGRFRRLRDDDAATPRMVSLRDRRLLEEFVPTMRETVERVLTEPDPAARNDHIESFWTALRDTLREASVSGADASELSRLLDADGTVRTSERRPADRERVTDSAVLSEPDAGRPLPGKPADGDGEFGDASRPARDLARDAVAREVTRQVASAADTDDTTPRATDRPGGPDAESPGEGDDTDRNEGGSGTPEADDGADAGGQAVSPGANGGEPERGSHPGAGSPPGASGERATADDGGTGRTDSSVGERYAEELAAEATELDDAAARLDALEEYVSALDAVGGDDLSLRVAATADDADAAPERWHAVRRDARRLARRFRSRLREQRRDVERTRRRRGSLDRSRLHAAARGRPDVFTQTADGDERRYTCAVVLDRSGSMGDGAVTAAETGALTAAAALEAVGVSVTVVDLYESTVRLVKTRVEEARDARERVLTERTGGGTPLSDALSLLRARLRDAENPFVLVVTDGQPDDAETYLRELDAVTFPVLGVYLTSPDGPGDRAVEADRSYFHRLAVVEDWSAVDQRLRRLAERVLF